MHTASKDEQTVGIRLLISACKLH